MKRTNKRIGLTACAALCLALCLCLGGCGGMNETEKNAVGEYALSDIQLIVSSGTPGETGNDHVLHGYDIGANYSQSEFMGVKISDYKNIYDATRDAKLTLSDKKSGKKYTAVFAYGTTSLSFKWKSDGKNFLSCSSLSLPAFDGNGAPAQVPCARAYLAGKNTVWLTVASKNISVRYVLQRYFTKS